MWTRKQGFSRIILGVLVCLAIVGSSWILPVQHAEAKKLTPAMRRAAEKKAADKILEDKLRASNAGSPVQKLSTGMFDELIGGEGQARSKPYLVKFYAPWCGHCRKMAPDYAEVGEEVEAKSKPVVIAAVNCNDFKEVCISQKIEGFPKLRYFRMDGTFVDYKNERVKDKILEFLDKELT